MQQRSATLEPVARAGEPAIDRLTVTALTIPTDLPESDGTAAWDTTTIVVAEPEAGGVTGLGYTYASAAAVAVAGAHLAPQVVGRSAFEIAAIRRAMSGAVRNVGRPGIAATAISAIDNALWDLEGRLLGLPVVDLLGRAREAIPAYGSGGFTSYDDATLARQLGGWADEGFAMVKMKIGRRPADDPRRVSAARDAIGPDVALFVDANGALDRKEALLAADWLATQGVTWFEEPVTSDDLDGLRLVRDRAPAGVEVAAGEYGWTPVDFLRLLDAGAVDVLQADATRCLGISGFMDAAALCEARSMPLSAHCAPSIHVHACCAARPARHLEWFHDHVRIERLLFDGAVRPSRGLLAPDRSRPGLGLDWRRADAEPYVVARQTWPA